MLVLTRKVGEKINIGDNVIISVVEVSGGNVRIGIQAPKRISILRHEIFERVKEQNLNATQGSAIDVQNAAKAFRTSKLKESRFGNRNKTIR